MSAIKSFRPSRAMENLNFKHKLELNVSSVACAIEALELLLIERGILKENELMTRLKEVARTKIEPGGDG